MSSINSVPADKGIPATLNCLAFGNPDINVADLDSLKNSISEIISGLALYTPLEECKIDLSSSGAEVISDELRKNANTEAVELCKKKTFNEWINTKSNRDLSNEYWIADYSENCLKEHTNRLIWAARTQESLNCVQNQLIDRLAKEKAALQKLHKLLAELGECKVNQQ